MSDHLPPSRSGRSGRFGRDGLPQPVGARTPGLDDLADDEPSFDSGHDAGRHPNYLIRRMVAVGVGVAIVAVAAVLIGRLVGGDDAPGTGEVPNSEWNTVVVLTDDEIRLVDPDNGDVVAAYPDANLLDAQSEVAGSVLLTLTDDGRVTQTDLGDGTVTRSRAGRDETLRLSRDNPDIAIIGPDAGGDVTIVDTATGVTSSVGEVAGLDDPLVFADEVRANRAGTHVAMSDARTFQTVVIDIAQDSAVLLAGQIVAIGDEVVVTAQRAGDNTELEFYDLLGARLGSADVPTPRASMLTPDATMVLVDAVGAVRTAEQDGSVTDIGGLLDPATPGATFDVTEGSAHLGGTRMLVSTSRQVFLLDESGAQIALASGEVTSSPTLGARCATVGSPRTTGTSVQLDLDSGEALVEVRGGIVSTASADGCTVALIGGFTPQIVVDGEIVDVDAGSVAAIAPDGTAYVVIDGRDTELVDVESGDVTEVTDVESIIRFAQR